MHTTSIFVSPANPDELFSRMAAQFPDAVCVCSVAGRVVRFANAAWIALTQRPLAAGDAAECILHAIHPDDVPGLRSRLAERPEGGVDHECRVLCPDTSVHWVRARTFGIAGSAGSIEAVAWLIHDITERRDASTRLLQLAHYDALTGLPNRTLLHESLTRALEQAHAHRWAVSILFIDIDEFKAVNDTLGHASGDELLRQFSIRLTQCLRIRDTVGRLGGDEFALVLIGDGATQAAEPVARKIAQVLRTPFSLPGGERVVTASIGVSLSAGRTLDGQSLVDRADAAMYVAKAAGGDGYRIFGAAADLWSRAGSALPGPAAGRASSRAPARQQTVGMNSSDPRRPGRRARRRAADGPARRRRGH